MPADRSLKPDPNRKGSYYRRIKDIGSALKEMDADNLPTVAQFVTYIFACEKLARGVVGIHSQFPAATAYCRHTKLVLCKIKLATEALNLSIAANDLDYLFADYQEQHLLTKHNSQNNKSARVVRNTLVHDFGPSHVKQVSRHANFLVPKMKKFLGCTNDVLAYLKTNFSDVP